MAQTQAANGEQADNEQEQDTEGELVSLTAAIERFDEACDGYGDRISPGAELQDRLSDAGIHTSVYTLKFEHALMRYGLPETEVKKEIREGIENSDEESLDDVSVDEVTRIVREHATEELTEVSE